jgi:N-acetyl-gamma-glutamyl-phosphate reductase
MAKLEKTELSFVIDAKTGASGAGRKPFLPLSFCELNQDIRPYKINRHQHSIEVLQQFEKISAKKMDLFFIPHLIGIERGILSTVYIDYGDFVKTDEILKCFNQCYQDSAFVQVFDSAEKISLKDVISTNKCHIGLSVFEKESKLVICSAIDNLQKGAAGQAVQNMNLMFGFDEKAGLI